MKNSILFITLWALPSFAQDIYEKVSGFLIGNPCLSYVTTSWKTPDRDAPIEVYFKDCDSGIFKLKVRAPKANCHGCGGIKGNPEGPVGNLQIKDGILILSFQGGSRNYWSDIYKWRFDKKKNDFHLIGKTFTSEDTVGEDPFERIDVNFSTGKIESSLGKKRKTCSSKKEPIYLSVFDFDAQQLMLNCPSNKK